MKNCRVVVRGIELRYTEYTTNEIVAWRAFDFGEYCQWGLVQGTVANTDTIFRQFDNGRIEWALSLNAVPSVVRCLVLQLWIPLVETIMHGDLERGDEGSRNFLLIDAPRVEEIDSNRHRYSSTEAAGGRGDTQSTVDKKWTYFIMK